SRLGLAGRAAGLGNAVERLAGEGQEEIGEPGIQTLVGKIGQPGESRGPQGGVGEGGRGGHPLPPKSPRTRPPPNGSADPNEVKALPEMLGVIVSRCGEGGRGERSVGVAQKTSPP